MWQSLRDADRILRGEVTRLPELKKQTIPVHLGRLFGAVAFLSILYGIAMGCFAWFNRPLDPAVWQALATLVKVPTLFLLTLAVTFPSLYVFNALVGSRLDVPAVLRLLMAALAVNTAVLASFGPIVAFFSVCTTSYAFMVLLNVVVFAVSGGLGMAFLLQTLHRLTIAQGQPTPPPRPTLPNHGEERADVSAEDLVEAQLAREPGALDRIEGHMLGQHVKTVFACWVVLFGLVGAQMGWVLRPFVGNPNLPFAFFRERKSNFFEAVWQTLQTLFS
jgi:hypothetical protein